MFEYPDNGFLASIMDEVQLAVGEPYIHGPLFSKFYTISKVFQYSNDIV